MLLSPVGHYMVHNTQNKLNRWSSSARNMICALTYLSAEGSSARTVEGICLQTWDTVLITVFSSNVLSKHKQEKLTLCSVTTREHQTVRAAPLNTKLLSASW